MTVDFCEECGVLTDPGRDKCYDCEKIEAEWSAWKKKGGFWGIRPDDCHLCDAPGPHVPGGFHCRKNK